MENNYTTPLARWARILEILIPVYMFGKYWGLADEKTVDLFRIQYPSFLIDTTEFLKGVLHTRNENLERLVGISIGAILGLILIALLATVIHYVLRDRKYVDSLRFTTVTLIPIGFLNQALFYAVEAVLENLGTQSTEVLTRIALGRSRTSMIIFFVFYMTSLWMLGRRTGVTRARRWTVIGVGIAFMAVYIASGVMITPSEWNELLPRLQQALPQ